MKNFGWILVAALSWSVIGCNLDKSQPNIELIQDMMEVEHIKPQEQDSSFKGGISAQVPPDNTAPIGFSPYKFGSDVNRAAKELKNPLAGQMDADVLLVCQKYYETQCMVCHGQRGGGDGPLATSKKYPLPIPSLTSDKIKAWTDGNIYHVITKGQGVMGAYASHVPEDVRWQLVNYIRFIQKN